MTGKASTLAAAAIAACALAAPAAAPASVVDLLGSDELLVSGLQGEENDVGIRYKAAGEGSLPGVSGRFEVSDEVGVVPQPGGLLPAGTCVNLSPTTISCDAGVIGALRVALGDRDDRLVVNAGKDEVPGRFPVAAVGGEGNDVIRGGVGRDRLFGERGNDVVAGWSGADTLGGGPGSDGLLGFGGDDTLKGGPGADALFGQKGRDRFFGGPGLDVLLARDGRRDRVVNCGRGSRQQAVVDVRDPRAKRCVELLPKKKGRQGR